MFDDWPDKECGTSYTYPNSNTESADPVYRCFGDMTTLYDNELCDAVCEPTDCVMRTFRLEDFKVYQLSQNGWTYKFNYPGEYTVIIRVYDKNDGDFLRHMDQAGVARRIFAIIMYLNTVDQGGETEVPDHNIKVKPEKGKVLIFPCNFMFYHQGNTPISGDKCIATAFINLSIPQQ